jgi:hypothetical protein
MPRLHHLPATPSKYFPWAIAIFLSLRKSAPLPLLSSHSQFGRNSPSLRWRLAAVSPARPALHTRTLRYLPPRVVASSSWLPSHRCISGVGAERNGRLAQEVLQHKARTLLEFSIPHSSFFISTSCSLVLFVDQLSLSFFSSFAGAGASGLKRKRSAPVLGAVGRAIMLIVTLN